VKGAKVTPTLDRETSALLIIDFQARLMPTIEDGTGIVANADACSTGRSRWVCPRSSPRSTQRPWGHGTGIVLRAGDPGTVEGNVVFTYLDAFDEDEADGSLVACWRCYVRVTQRRRSGCQSMTYSA
jgi:hypothetical protein